MMSPDRIAIIEAEMDSTGLREVYDRLIASGNSPNMAAMLASQQAPGVWNTEANFTKRENERMSSMGSDRVEDIVKIARRAGINTQGKTYNGSLGKYDDPSAWVSGKDDVRAAAIAKGMNIDGMVKVDGYRGPKKKKRLADDIVDDLERNARSKNAKLDESCKKSDNARKDLRKQIIDKHGSKKKD